MLSSDSTTVNRFLSAFRELGCNGSDEMIKALLLACNNNLDMAVDRWLERGFTGVIVKNKPHQVTKSPVVELLSPEKKIDLSDSDSDYSDEKVVLSQHSKSTNNCTVMKSQGEIENLQSNSLKMEEDNGEMDYLFIGKRNIDESYTLSEGTYAVRQQSLGFRLEGNSTKNNNNNKMKKSAAATKSTKLKVPGTHCHSPTYSLT